jgi:signal transduction histidine kinase
MLMKQINDDQGLIGGPIEILERNYNFGNQEQSEQKARESERLALLGTKALIFAHEVANPLTGISTSLQLVQSEFERREFNDSFLTDTLHSVLREIDRLGSLLNEFRSLARPPSLDLKSTCLRTIIQEVLALENIAYRAAGVTVKVEFENGLPPVEVDAGKMKQVILNLCKNGVEAMREGGCLALKAYRLGPTVVLEVSDDGIGVPEGVNIFELFKTTKTAGSGLGLPLVQQIVSAHKGTINYTSDSRHKTTFAVRLPAATCAV